MRLGRNAIDFLSTAIAAIRSGLPPGPKGTIVGGNVRQFRAVLLNFLLETAREYGPLASFRIGPRRVFLANGPDLIEQVLVTDAKHYIKHFGARAFKPVLGTDWLRARARFGIDNESSFNPRSSRSVSSLIRRSWPN